MLSSSRLQYNQLPIRINGMPAVLLVPHRERSGLICFLYNLTPTPGIVRTEGNFSLLSCNRRRTHLDILKIEVEQILKPHSTDDQKAPLTRPFNSGPKWRRTTDPGDVLVKYVKKIIHRETIRGSVRLEV